jgi:hypothetical protein
MRCLAGKSARSPAALRRSERAFALLVEGRFGGGKYRRYGSPWRDYHWPPKRQIPPTLCFLTILAE